jgi:hypothetical protein
MVQLIDAGGGKEGGVLNDICCKCSIFGES